MCALHVRETRSMDQDLADARWISLPLAKHNTGTKGCKEMFGECERGVLIGLKSLKHGLRRAQSSRGTEETEKTVRIAGRWGVGLGFWFILEDLGLLVADC